MIELIAYSIKAGLESRVLMLKRSEKILRILKSWKLAVSFPTLKEIILINDLMN